MWYHSYVTKYERLLNKVNSSPKHTSLTELIKLMELVGFIWRRGSKNIKDAMYDWVETALLNGEKVPTPEGFSGKFTVRIPSSLHRDLIKKVTKEGVSINQFITTAIARAVGF